jgi:glc operon protein GlcG
MTKLGIGVGILATVFCSALGAQTINVMVLDQAGAQTVLQAAKASAQQRNAPSAIAVVDPAGDLLAFQRMDGVRAASADLAIEKARTAARLQRPTEEIEDSINQGRTAFVTAGIAALRGGMPIRVNGEVVGAVGVAGLSKETDTGIANAAAAALSPSSKTPQRR